MRLNPLEDTAWDRRLSAFPDASCFHTASWMRVIHDTYGHLPSCLATRRPEGFGSLLPAMQACSILSGRRGVSLPFTDCCEPLFHDKADAGKLVEAAILHARDCSWRYLEFRGSAGIPSTAQTSARYLTHQLDLQKPEASLWGGVSGAARRGVRKARDSGVVITTGRDETAMREFFRLHCLTRKRHGVPPQPVRFFNNIRRILAENGLATLMLASYRGKAVAAAVFLHFGTRVTYKFGASDMAFQQTRANNLLMWESIRLFAAQGMHDLHMGRSDTGDAGLRRFKLGWGTTESELTYHRYDPKLQAYLGAHHPQRRLLRMSFRRLPISVSKVIGSAIYPHLV